MSLYYPKDISKFLKKEDLTDKVENPTPIVGMMLSLLLETESRFSSFIYEGIVYH